MSQQQEERESTDMAADLEPWVPDSLRERLVVGARVRFHVRECVLVHNGAEATICGIMEINPDRHDGHHYLLKAIEGMCWGFAAASELEPLDGEGD